MSIQPHLQVALFAPTVVRIEWDLTVPLNGRVPVLSTKVLANSPHELLGLAIGPAGVAPVEDGSVGGLRDLSNAMSQHVIGTLLALGQHLADPHVA